MKSLTTFSSPNCITLDGTAIDGTSPLNSLQRLFALHSRIAFGRFVRGSQLSLCYSPATLHIFFGSAGSASATLHKLLALRALLRQLFMQFGFAGSAPATLRAILALRALLRNSSQIFGFAGSAPATLHKLLALRALLRQLFVQFWLCGLCSVNSPATRQGVYIYQS